MQNIVIIGATSAIAEAVARLFAERGDRLYLLARNQERLAAMAADLHVRGAEDVRCGAIDMADTASHGQTIADVCAHFSTLDVVLLAAGTLPDQAACVADFATAQGEITVNAIAPIALLTELANRFEQQGSGTLAVITSVAGDRGRQSNYVYGASKAMVSVFLQGLRNRLFKSGVAVLDIKPGFVDTPMTAAFPKGALWAQPSQVAADIVEAIDKRRARLYTPWFWRWIMLVIGAIPEVIFKRLSL